MSNQGSLNESSDEHSDDDQSEEERTITPSVVGRRVVIYRRFPSTTRPGWWF